MPMLTKMIGAFVHLVLLSLTLLFGYKREETVFSVETSGILDTLSLWPTEAS